VPSSSSAVPLSSSVIASSSSSSSAVISSSSAVLSSSSSKPTDGVECDGYCKWNDGCVRIATDPKGVREPGKSLPPITSCEDAILNCKNYSPTGNVFSNSTCDIAAVIIPSSSSYSSVFLDKGNDIANYKTTRIYKDYMFDDDQIWMAENLNYAVEGSRCYGEDAPVVTINEDYYVTAKTLSKAEIQANCDKYGRLYSWEAAMALPDSCYYNTAACASQVSAKHRGICPSGWHIPSDDDWNKLFSYVNDIYGKNTEGRNLKATNGWNSCGSGSSYSYKCEDTFGFSALPGGIIIQGNTSTAGIRAGNCNPDYSYSDEVARKCADSFCSCQVGDIGYWWSSSRQSGYRMNYDSDRVVHSGASFVRLWSVRCLKD